jgi:hypothetical protein
VSQVVFPALVLDKDKGSRAKVVVADGVSKPALETGT